NGQLVDAVHYFPFGEVWLEERPSSLPADYFFTAKELDSETGFYDFGARYLDPRFSKWMSVDPADQISAGAPIAALNPYQYGLHNPVRHFDPNGEQSLDSIENRTCFWFCSAAVEAFKPGVSLEAAARHSGPFTGFIGPAIAFAGYAGSAGAGGRFVTAATAG